MVVQPPTPLLAWEKEYLCSIFCDCLQQWKAQKNEVPLGDLDLDSLESIRAFRTSHPGRFERQGCVEKELRAASHPNFQPEKEYYVGGRKKIPDVSVFGSGGQLTSVVEMKFPGDKWQDGQEAAYEEIAKRHNAQLVLLNEDSCQCA